jgi:uncharacterized coiled-coil protein SlyX
LSGDPTLAGIKDSAKRIRALEDRIAHLDAQIAEKEDQINTMRYETVICRSRDAIAAIHDVLKDLPEKEADVYEALHRVKPFDALCLGDLFAVIDHAQNPYEVDQKDCQECGWCGCKTPPQRLNETPELLPPAMPTNPAVDVMR